MGQSIPDMPPRRVAYELARHAGTTQDDLISRMTLDDFAAWATYMQSGGPPPDAGDCDGGGE